MKSLKAVGNGVAWTAVERKADGFTAVIRHNLSGSVNVEGGKEESGMVARFWVRL